MSALLDAPATPATISKGAAKTEKFVMTSGPDFHSHPTYFRERQQAAWEEFTKLPMPARTDENWRFADVKALDLSSFHRAPDLSELERTALRLRSGGLGATAGRMVFANDRLIQHDIFGDALRAKGVLWLPLEQAIAEQRELVEKHFMREGAILGSQKFAALHESQVRNGTFLYVPRGVEVAQPIECFHWVQGAGAAIFPHTIIVAEAGSKVTVVDHFQSATAEPGLSIGANDIIVGDGAKVTYIAVQQFSEQSLAFRINNTVVGRDASALALVMNLGGRYVRSEAASHLRAPSGRSDMLSITCTEDSQCVDQRTLQIHEAPNTASDLLYKNSLGGQSRTIFTGLIRVNPGAHKTDAYQKVRNLLLTDEAEANSAPGLEIEADDVRCTHGATSGQVDTEELFYLLSRGIPLREAQRLVVFGFLNEVTERLPEGELCEMLRDKLHARLG